MSWVSFATGAMAVLIAYAFFSREEEERIEVEPNETIFGSRIIDNEFTGRYVTLSCQTCRKLKRHKEIEPNLYQCSKCKRHVDLRIVS